MLKLVCCGLVLCTLAGCGGNPPAPIEDRHARKGESYSSRYYTVQRGETLYSIAFRYGLDYRVVAAANGIAAPYTIYPGQKINLQKSTAVPVAVTPQVPVSRPATSSPTPQKPAGISKPAPAKPVVQKPAAPKPVAATATTPASKPASSGSSWTGSAVRSWRWPSTGRVTRGYSSTVHKGIDISGKRGDAIVSVAPGKVVYAGTGIVGFGELLIVKHNDEYLSAYGHNDRLLVAEGQTVSTGQNIATKGSSGTDTVKLHFEIRKGGKPIDPMKLLPKR